MIDGSAILWVIHWPTQGTVQYLVGNVVSYVTGKMKDADEYFIFDRYEDYRAHRRSHSHRTGEGSKHLADTIKCHSQCIFQKQQLSSTNHKLMATGRDPVPVEIRHGTSIRREDLRNAHE